MPADHNRRSIAARLRQDLLGPLSEDEILSCRPSDRYLTGILFPQRSETPGEEQDALGTGEDDTGEAGTETVASDRQQRHSSAGISFAVSADGDAHAIDTTISGARYEPFWLDAEGKPTSTEGFAKDVRWRRQAVFLQLPQIPVVPGSSDRVDLEQHGLKGLMLRLHAAPVAGQPNLIAVTVVLVNTMDEANASSRIEREKMALFQAEVRIAAAAGSYLEARPSRRSGEDQDLRLIYRNVKEYAVGHVCAARWNEHEGRVLEVATTWLPESTVSAVSADGDPCFDSLRNSRHSQPLSASWLASASADQLCNALRLLPAAYGAWLDDRQPELSGVPSDLLAQADLHLGDGRRVQQRVEKSIELVEKNERIRFAFQFANEAMVLQRRWTRATPDLTWRPFQLAFQLLVLESVANRTSDERLVMDLLWFPTGGGKTEAYLGLISFVLFYRRLSQDSASMGSGCGVIMRYTLRLLTIQQFQRASSLILACEFVRRRLAADRSKSQLLGATAFSIGLWVGGGATPNTAEEAVGKLLNDSDPTPRQLVACPACQKKESLDWRVQSRTNTKGDEVPEQVQVHCTNRDCPLSGMLPIWTVDEDVYRERPSLLIGTVDKFAQIVRKPAETARLFGDSCDPPDLIIQDELHLISGPLGTLTGLYEVAIDELCSRTKSGAKIRPKVIGSTATIRRAAEQGKQLFNRNVQQFPPPILDAENSCFAIRDNVAPGRVYVGVTSAGRSPKFTLQAVCGSLLQAASNGRTPTPPEWDPWWTLVTYFNSLRELGGALVMFYDDVPASLQLYAGIRNEVVRELGNIDELTSRKKQSELRDTLADLEYPVGESGALDAVLATNMLSVGVDVPRLGLMVVNGQPKQVAEYIQATSRVGRSHPGLIVSVYNNGKVRDRSHFETFSTWHAALYRDVEPTSVTPFASRAVDRALHAVLCALARHQVHGLRTSPKLTPERRAALEQAILPLIEARVTAVDSAELPGVRARLQRLLDHWEERVRGWGNALGGKDPAWWHDQAPEKSLLVSSEVHAARKAAGLLNSQAWATPNSMREVEPGTPLKLMEWMKLPEGPNAS